MLDSNRRLFMQAFAFGATAFTGSRAFAQGRDGHASGYDVSPADDFAPTLPRKPGDAVVFTASLDSAPIKATSGGWARDVTARGLPIATDLAGAHLFVNPGGVREMHWHNSAEWAYIIDGHCQVTVVDPDGEVEVVNIGPGDLWYFPHGHSHAIQTLGDAPCHAILAFDDGLYSEHGTFGLSDLTSRYARGQLAQTFGVPAATMAGFPEAEVYINQGAVLALDGPEAAMAAPLPRERSHGHGLVAAGPRVRTAGGELYVASAAEFPVSTAMTGTLLKLAPGAMHEPHWHPNASEWHYVLKGRVRVTLYAEDKRLAVAEIGVGDCAYIPKGCAHMIENVGGEPAEIVGALNSGRYVESRLSDWVAKVPRHLLAANLGVAEAELPAFAPAQVIAPARA